MLSSPEGDLCKKLNNVITYINKISLVVGVAKSNRWIEEILGGGRYSMSKNCFISKEKLVLT